MPKQQKASKSWFKLEEAMLNQHASRFNALLATMDDEEFAKNYTKMLEFFVSKKQRSEIIDNTDPADKVVRIEYVQSEQDELDGVKGFDGISQN